MRVFLGPLNVAGILWNYKIGLREWGVDAKVMVREKHRYGYPVDEVYHIGRDIFLRRYKAIRYLSRFIKDFDIFHFVSGDSVFGNNIDIPVLKFTKKKIVMSFLGSDIRCSTEVLNGNKKKEECNYCGYPCSIIKKLHQVKDWYYNANAIYSGIDNSQILDYLSIPYHHIILPCDINYWKPFKSNIYRKKKDRILIVHAPSSLKMKGTDIVIKALNKLKKDGKNIEFKLLYNEPNVLVRNWLNTADIVIDRAYGRGWYGSLAVESMALAKPTIGYINPEYLENVKYGKQLPVINLFNENLYDNLISLIDDAELRTKIGAKSRKYVEDIHDSKIVCKNLLNIYHKLVE